MIVQQQLPGACEIAPAAEVAFMGQTQAMGVLRALQAFDAEFAHWQQSGDKPL